MIDCLILGSLLKGKLQVICCEACSDSDSGGQITYYSGDICLDLMLFVCHDKDIHWSYCEPEEMVFTCGGKSVHRLNSNQGQQLAWWGSLSFCLKSHFFSNTTQNHRNIHWSSCEPGTWWPIWAQNLFTDSIQTRDSNWHGEDHLHSDVRTGDSMSRIIKMKMIRLNRTLPLPFLIFFNYLLTRHVLKNLC